MRNRLGGKNESYFEYILILKHPQESQMEMSKMNQALEMWKSKKRSRGDPRPRNTFLVAEAWALNLNAI